MFIMPQQQKCFTHNSCDIILQPPLDHPLLQSTLLYIIALSLLMIIEKVLSQRSVKFLIDFYVKDFIFLLFSVVTNPHRTRGRGNVL